MILGRQKSSIPDDQEENESIRIHRSHAIIQTIPSFFVVRTFLYERIHLSRRTPPPVPITFLRICR